MVVQFVTTHNKIPSGKILELELKKVQAPDDVLTRTQELITEMKDRSDIDIDYLIAESEKWCKDRAVYNAIMESIKIIDELFIINQYIKLMHVLCIIKVSY